MVKSWKFPVYSVLGNYDGDTFKLLLDLGYSVHRKVTVRLIGVDTPELRGGTVETKTLARAARDRARYLVGNADKLDFISFGIGKYGRALGDIICDDVSLVETLINERYGVPYEGGSRKDMLIKHIENAEYHEKLNAFNQLHNETKP